MTDIDIGQADDARRFQIIEDLLPDIAVGQGFHVVVIAHHERQLIGVQRHAPGDQRKQNAAGKRDMHGSGNRGFEQLLVIAKLAVRKQLNVGGTGNQPFQCGLEFDGGNMAGVNLGGGIGKNDLDRRGPRDAGHGKRGHRRA